MVSVPARTTDVLVIKVTVTVVGTTFVCVTVRDAREVVVVVVT